MKSETAGGGQGGRLRWRNALVVTQLTISLVILVGAGLFLRSLQQQGRHREALEVFALIARRFSGIARNRQFRKGSFQACENMPLTVNLLYPELT